MFNKNKFIVPFLHSNAANTDTKYVISSNFGKLSRLNSLQRTELNMLSIGISHTKIQIRLVI